MRVRVRRPVRLRGEITLPGDKSISHRALILNAIAAGRAALGNLSGSADVASTMRCLRALGVEVDATHVRGAGLHGLRAAAGPLDCGNSGTSMRLLAGLLAAQPFESVLVGDESLSRRPMERVTAPLRLMGAAAESPPLRVGGRTPLHGVRHQLAVPSAQVKSALLLAGLYAVGPTSIVEPVKTRDHTELMLRAMGVAVEISASEVSVLPPDRLDPLDVVVPGDLSAAAFWLVAAGCHPEAELRLPAVGVNPTRTRILDLLETIGWSLRRTQPAESPEPRADLAVSSTDRRQPFVLGAEQIAELIDEVPVLAVAATQCEGESPFTGAGELRVKESDRIAGMVGALSRLGAEVSELDDGFVVRGPSQLRGALVDCHGDHRLAMALAVAGMLASGETEIDHAECVDISYPGFWAQVGALGGLA